MNEDMFSSPGEFLAKIKIDDKSIGISKKSRDLYGSLNGVKLIQSESKEKFVSRSIPVLSMIASNIPVKESVKVYGNKPEYIDQILKSIRDNHEDVEILMLSLAPDEQVENSPREVKAAQEKKLIRRIKSYKKIVKNSALTVQEVNNLSDILLRTRFSPSMWGGKTVLGLMSSINKDKSKISTTDFDAAVERSDKALDKVAMMIMKPKMFSVPVIKKSIDGVINDFSIMKTSFSKLSQSLYDLFDIDRQFKKHTGYPVTWFFNSSMFYDFAYHFENLVRNLMETSKIESGLIEPLFVWKVRKIGDDKCQTI